MKAPAKQKYSGTVEGAGEHWYRCQIKAKVKWYSSSGAGEHWYRCQIA